ncbi:hypothetical protein QBC37DRAFT_415308, partial [Rhypophila decipiens]
MFFMSFFFILLQVANGVIYLVSKASRKGEIISKDRIKVVATSHGGHWRIELRSWGNNNGGVTGQPAHYYGL